MNPPRHLPFAPPPTPPITALYVIFVATAPMVTQQCNSWAAALISRVPPSPTSLHLQSLAQDHTSQVIILLYSLWVTRDLLRRSCKVRMLPLTPTLVLRFK